MQIAQQKHPCCANCDVDSVVILISHKLNSTQLITLLSDHLLTRVRSVVTTIVAIVVIAGCLWLIPGRIVIRRCLIVVPRRLIVPSWLLGIGPVCRSSLSKGK